MTKIGTCQHCGTAIYDTTGDKAQAALAAMCWKCSKPHGITR